MNFTYGVIVAVGILVAISIGLIIQSPDTIIEPRVIPEKLPKAPAEELPVACTLEYAPVCGVDGITYGNMCMLDASKVDLDYQGECIVVEPTPEPEPIPEPESVPPSTMPVAPQTHTIEIPEGSGAPGCETTNSCYIPYSLNIQVGDIVLWDNVDTAAHTVTSGTIEGGPDGVFDSSLFMSGNTFSHTFEKSGEYPYFCMVHPWMIGEIIVTEVNDVEVVSESMPVPDVEPTVEIIVEPEPTIQPLPETLPMTVNVSLPQGSAAPGCETTNSCYIPYEVKIAVGGTVTWSNDDSAAHSVTGGHLPEGPSGVFDSGLFMAGNTFSHTFEKSGEYPYFCMVHPWMTGIVIVE